MGIEEKDTLIVESQTKGFPETHAAVKAAKDDVYDLADSYEVLGVENTSVFTTAQQVGIAMRAQASAMNTVEVAAASTATALDKTAAATGRASRGVAGFGQTGLQTGRIVQDFAQGGIGGVLNNIEGFIQAIGMGPGAAGALTVLGVAAFVAKPHLEALWEKIGPEKARDATDAMGLTETVKRLKENKGTLSIDVRELDIAEQKLKNLIADQAAWDAAQHKQTKAEAEAGKKVGETLTETAGGEESVAGDVKANVLKEFTDPTQNLLIKATHQAEAAAEKRLADAEAAIARPSMSQGEAQGKASELAEAQKQILDARKRRQEAETKAADDAEREYGRLKRLATEGHGAEQQAAQEELARRIRQTGRQGLADQVAGATPQRVKQDKDFDDAAEQTFAELEKAKDDQKKIDVDRKKVQQQHIDDLVKSGSLDAKAAAATAAIDAEGLDLDVAFQRVRKELQSEILARLTAQGVSITKAEEASNAAAESLTQEAFTKAEIREKAAAKAADRAEAAAGKKQAKGEAKTDDQAFAAEADRVLDQLKAEAKRIDHVFGKEADARFGAGMASAPAGANPQEVATQLVQEMTLAFRRNGATAQGAGLAARNVAARQGFEVGVQAQPRTFPGQVDRFGRPVRANAPKGGKKPLKQAKVKAVAAVAQARPFVGPPKPPAPKPKPAPLPDANAALEARKQALAKPDDQAALDQTLKTQGAISGVQENVSALEAKLRASDARVARLEANSRQTNTRIQESQPSAQPSGTGVA